MKIPALFPRHYIHESSQCSQNYAKFVNVYVHEHEHGVKIAKAARLKAGVLTLIGTNKTMLLLNLDYYTTSAAADLLDSFCSSMYR